MSGFLMAAMITAVTAAVPVELQRAEELVRQFKYAKALSALEKARSTKRLDRPSLLRILALQGIAAGQLRQTALASTAFRELLSLDPGHTLDADYAPRVMTPFMEAGQAVNEQGSLQFREGKAETTATRVTSLSVELSRDPLKMARAVVFHVREGPAWKAIPVTLRDGKATLTVDAAEVSWWAELMGENEAQLALVGSQATPQMTAPPPPAAVVLAPPPPPPAVLMPASEVAATTSGGSVRTASYFVVGGAAVAAGVGAAFGVLSSAGFSKLQQAQRDEAGVISGLTERQANTIAADAARDGTIANACFIGAGALAVGGALMFFLGAPVSVAPTPGGVVVSGRLP
jgi:hypothetical protein